MHAAIFAGVCILPDSALQRTVCVCLSALCVRRSNAFAPMLRRASHSPVKYIEVHKCTSRIDAIEGQPRNVDPF
eukprot:3185937-Rhodomonas_salina.1